MALEQGVRVHFEVAPDSRVTLENADPRWGTRTFPVSADLAPGERGDWGNYAMAAAVTVAREFGASTGIRGTVSSDLPPAAGLSSSSALVVAVAGALLEAAGIRVDRLELAGAVARGEQFTGTAGGAMDQTASLTGRAGHALFVEFEPMASTPIPLPDAWSVVVAHSGVSARKSGEVQGAYNARRAETTRALEDAAVALGAGQARPRALLDSHGVEAVSGALRRLGTRGGEWAVHVAEEYGRVLEAVETMKAGDLERFGELLNDSHRSLRDTYEVSHPSLDLLTGAARAAGAAGARLTGAGFGGCIVAVCGVQQEEAVLASLARTQSRLDPEPEVAPFVVGAGQGARVLD
jgi:galactokinase